MWVIGSLGIGLAYAILENHKHGKQQVAINSRLTAIELALQDISEIQNTTNIRLDTFIKNEIDVLKHMVKYRDNYDK